MNEFVNVPVPTDRVHEVYALLASPPASGRFGQPEPAGVDPANGGDWTPELVRRLYEESADAMQRLLKYLAKEGREVSTNELADALGLKGASSVAGMAGAVGRRVASRYGMTNGMPWTKRWHYIDTTDPSKGTETLLALPDWICDIINEL